MKKKALSGIALFAIVILAACAPGAGTGTPGVGTDFPVTDLTEPVGTDVAMTPIASPSAAMTDSATEAGTAVGTAVSTDVATEAGTAVSTPQATAASTTAAGTQTTPTTDQAVLIRASDLVGLEIQGDSGGVLGVVDEVLVDEAGNVQFIVFDAGEALGMDRHLVAVEWSMFEIQPGDEAITFMGTETELQEAPLVDEAMFDSPGFYIGEGTDTSGTTTTATPAATGSTMADLTNLIRVGRFTDFDLRNTEDEDLGEVEDLVVDAQQGMVQTAVVNFGGFLGIGEKSVAVPWEQLILSTVADDPDARYFLLDVPRETLETAPQIDNLDETLPAWPEPINPNWDREARTFWQELG
jgi:sporulation protein YlmC with PRC-barrel domain